MLQQQPNSGQTSRYVLASKVCNSHKHVWGQTLSLALQTAKTLLAAKGVSYEEVGRCQAHLAGNCPASYQHSLTHAPSAGGSCHAPCKEGGHACSKWGCAAAAPGACKRKGKQLLLLQCRLHSGVKPMGRLLCAAIHHGCLHSEACYTGCPPAVHW